MLEQEIEQRHEDHEHEKLAELDADIEREQRRQEMRSGELQRVLEHEGEAEPVHEPEREGYDPARGRVRFHDVLERHVEDRHRDQRLDQRRKPQRLRRELVGGCDQRDRVRDRERGHDRDERAEAAERDDEQEQKQQVVGAFEDVLEAEHDEAPDRLVPARIEPHQTGIAFELVDALGHAGGQKTDRGNHRERKSFELRIDGEIRAIRLDRIFEQHIEDALFPKDRRVRRKRRARDMGERAVVILERAIGFERELGRDDARRGQRCIAFVHFQIVDQEDLGGVPKRLIDAREIDIFLFAAGNLDILDALHGHADEHLQNLPFRLDEGLNGDVARNEVRNGRRRHEKGQRRQQQRQPAERDLARHHD